jgi:hypothetical protein
LMMYRAVITTMEHIPAQMDSEKAIMSMETGY